MSETGKLRYQFNDSLQRAGTALGAKFTKLMMKVLGNVRKRAAGV